MTARSLAGGDCAACAHPIALHFAEPHGAGRFLGCLGARAVARYLAGHGLPPFSLRTQPAQEFPNPTSPRRSQPSLQPGKRAV